MAIFCQLNEWFFGKFFALFTDGCLCFPGWKGENCSEGEFQRWSQKIRGKIESLVQFTCENFVLRDLVKCVYFGLICLLIYQLKLTFF